MSRLTILNQRKRYSVCSHFSGNGLSQCRVCPLCSDAYGFQCNHMPLKNNKALIPYLESKPLGRGYV